MNVVWLKRDLRISDHRPLVEACARGDVLVLYVVEPELLAQPETDAAHVTFAAQSLAELERELRARGGALTVRIGNLPEAFEALHRERPFRALFAHEETGSGVTYARDKRVARWCKERGVEFREWPQTGVVRRLRTRDGWAERWDRRMREPPARTPDRVPCVSGVEPGALFSARELGLAPTTLSDVQVGGSAAARATLESFLARRGVDYARHMSSPVTAWEGCSRLSPHLAFGTLSMREVVAASRARRAELEGAPGPLAGRFRMSLAAFESRLRWHCHFMQKLEDEPRLEHEALSRAHASLREGPLDAERLAAWCEGRTGYPMVDACMRALRATGWINFRMRSMLVSFASYDLWLPFRPTGLHLARHFLDFEAGIHWSQMQMQSGTTGMNTLRTYSPTKQLRDHDPDGVFVRRWVPELARVPTEHLAEPWRMSSSEARAAGCEVGVHYPRPIVSHELAVKEARARIGALRRTPEAQEEAARIVTKHGSRKRPPIRRASPGS